MKSTNEERQSTNEELLSTSEEPAGTNGDLLNIMNDADTERKKAADRLQEEHNKLEAVIEALRTSERHLREAQRLAHIGSWHWVVATDTVTWSEELYRITGLDPAYPAPNYVELASFYDPESWQRLSEAVERALATGEPYDVELNMIRADGEVRHTATRGEVQRDAEGRIVGLHGTAQDITEHRRAAEALRASEIRYRRIIETTNEGFGEIDMDGRIISVNPRMEELFGVSPGALVGVHILDDLLFPEDRAAMRERMTARGEGRSEQYEQRFRRADGGEFWAIVSATPVRDAAGAITGSFAMMVDITENRKVVAATLRESEEKFRTLTTMAPVGIYQTDAHGRCLYVNSRWCEMAGMNAEAALGDGWVTAVHPDDRGVVSSRWKEMVAAEGRWGLEYRFQTPDDKIRWIYGLAMPLRDASGEISSYIGINTDITERKQAEEERERLLAREQAALAESRAALQDRDEFITVGAHELKTPIAALQLQIEGMRRLLGRGEVTTAQLNRGLEIEERQIKRLVRLVTGLLDITRIQTGYFELNRRSCDLVRLIREILSNNQSILQRSGCEASYSGPESIQTTCDPDRMEQVLENILGNAVKFAPGTRIDILCDETPTTVRISIRDRGPGIHATDLERIFEPYEQGRGHGQRVVGGLGMGLFISREIISAHGGVMRAENAEDGGTLFIIELPRENVTGKSDGSMGAFMNIAEQRRAREAIRESESRLSDIFNNLDALVYIADMQTYELLFVNKYGIKLFGDITGKVCWQALQAGQTGPCNFCTNDRLLRPDGTPAGVHVWEFQNTVTGNWYECRDSAIHWPDGRIVRMEIATDITERKRSEEMQNKLAAELRNFKMILDRTLDCIFIFGAEDLRFTYVNDGAKRQTGYTEAELLRMTPLEIKPEFTLERFRRMVQPLIEGVQPSLTFQTVHRHKDGHDIPVEVFLQCVRLADESPNFVAVVRDITDRG